ncbi:MAG: hypothetical protein U0228_02175 [Myxococcaceae bacterium]
MSRQVRVMFWVLIVSLGAGWLSLHARNAQLEATAASSQGAP